MLPFLRVALVAWSRHSTRTVTKSALGDPVFIPRGFLLVSVAQPLFHASSLSKCRVSKTDGVTLLQVKETTAEFLRFCKIIWLDIPSVLLPLLSAFLGEANTGHAIHQKTISYTPTGLHFRAGLAVLNAAMW